MLSGLTETGNVQVGRASLVQFLRALWPNGFLDQWCLFWTRTSKQSLWTQDINDSLIDQLLALAERDDVYIGCGLRAENLGYTVRGDRDAVAAIPGLWLDVDVCGPGHRKPNLPPTEADARQLLAEMGLPPTMVVHTGGGLQAWWCFREPWILDSEEERTAAERLTKGWCTTLRAKAKGHGWDADQVGDLPRVMRVPGLWNHKGATPRRILLPHCDDKALYNLDDVEAYLLADLGERELGDQQTWQFELNPSAEPPTDKFLLLSEIDTTFKRSWMHARRDLQDQSASSYDLSLATRALATGWSAQEVVNLLIAHRRKHHQDLKLRRAYYERTLNRAASGKNQDARKAFVEDLQAGTALSDVARDDAAHVNGQTTALPSDTRTFPLSDTGNAEHFAATQGNAVRYDHRQGRWLLWRTHRWCLDVDAEIRRLAKASIRHRFTTAAACEHLDERSRLAKWALSSESRARLEALLALAQAEPPIADAGDNWDQAPLLLGVPNGVIDLRTGQLRAGRQEDRLTMSAATPFDPNAAAPRWDRFIHEVFGGDAALTAFVQRAIGYSLTGDTEEQCLFLCYGTGANGKGTLLNTLHSMLGDYGWNMPFSTVELSQRTSIPNDMAALVGRRFIVASETNDGTRLNESRIKTLTGCDPITARFLHAEFFTFKPIAKLWLCVNHKPVVRDDSHGFWRRIRLIPFQQTFSVDTGLAKALQAERPGILAWAVRGCLAWQQFGGLNPPTIVTEATSTYARESDPLAEFLEEFCRLAPDAEAGAAEMYAHYTGWANYRGLSERERLTCTMLGRKMGERFPSEKTRSGKHYKGVSRRPV